jgi:hypothetical protein
MREVAHNGGAPTPDKATAVGAVAHEASEMGGEDDQIELNESQSNFLKGT